MPHVSAVMLVSLTVGSFLIYGRLSDVNKQWFFQSGSVGDHSPFQKVAVMHQKLVGQLQNKTGEVSAYVYVFWLS